MSTPGRNGSPAKYTNAIPTPTGSQTIAATGPANSRWELSWAAASYRARSTASRSTQPKGPFGSTNLRGSSPRTAVIDTTRHMVNDSQTAFVARAAKPRHDLVAPLVRSDQPVAVAGDA